MSKFPKNVLLRCSASLSGVGLAFIMMDTIINRPLGWQFGVTVIAFGLFLEWLAVDSVEDGDGT